MSRLEAKLSQEKCIWPLAAWERRYQFWTNVYRGAGDNGKTYTTIIDFRLRRAGTFNVNAGRKILPPTPHFSDEIDDTPVDMAWGTFDLTNGRLNLTYCGPNYSP